MYKTIEEVDDWLIEMEVKNYFINEDLTVDVNGDVNLSYKELKEIPIQFGVVNGDFYCFHNNLLNLKGCPKEVEGAFHCCNNKLTSLEGCPNKVKGSFYCSNNDLTNFNYFPNEINGYYIEINGNAIRKEILANFSCEMKNIRYIYSDFNKKGDLEEFFNKVNFYKSKKDNELLKELISENSNTVKLNKKL